jgi:hypothetical protein
VRQSSAAFLCTANLCRMGAESAASPGIILTMLNSQLEIGIWSFSKLGFCSFPPGYRGCFGLPCAACSNSRKIACSSGVSGFSLLCF